MSLIDKLQTLIPNVWAGIAIHTGIGMAGAVFGIAEIQSLTPYLPSWLLPVPQRTVACLGIVVAGSWVAFFLMVRAYKQLERAHVEELARLQSVPASAQGGSTATRVSRRDLLRSLDMDPMP